jgi:hypothetical protein
MVRVEAVRVPVEAELIEYPRLSRANPEQPCNLADRCPLRIVLAHELRGQSCRGVVDVRVGHHANQLPKYSHMALAWRDVRTSGNSCGPGGSMRQSPIRSMNGTR